MVVLGRNVACGRVGQDLVDEVLGGGVMKQGVPKNVQGKTCRGVASGRDILAPQIRPSLSLGGTQLVYLAMRGPAMIDTPC